MDEEKAKLEFELKMQNEKRELGAMIGQLEARQAELIEKLKVYQCIYDLWLRKKGGKNRRNIFHQIISALPTFLLPIRKRQKWPN